MSATKQAPTHRAATPSIAAAPSAAPAARTAAPGTSNRALAALFRKAQDDEQCEKCSGTVHRQAAGGPAGPPETPPVVHQVLRSPGQPLADGVRTDMERCFGGADFRAVRVHTDARAAESAEAVHAKAYTVGSQIAFGRGEYAPDTPGGASLMAHELAHVVQSGGATPAVQRLAIDPADSPAEREAESLAHRATGVGAIQSLPHAVATPQAASAVRRWPWSDDKPKTKTNREFIDTAFTSRKPGDVNDIPFAAYGEASVSEKFDLIRILVSKETNWMVGPINQIAAKELWRSLGPAVLANDGEAAPLWKLSVDRDVRLSDLPVVQAFVKQFRDAAVGIAQIVLNESETRVTSEQGRYGLSSKATVRPGATADSAGGPPQTVSDTQHSMAANPDSANAATVARDLAARIGRLRELQSQQAALVWKFSKRGTTTEMITDPEKHRQLGLRIRDESLDYDSARGDAETHYPILAGFAQRKDQTGLERIASGSSGQAASTLNQEIAEKLANIQKVREAFKDENSTLIWSLDRVLGLARISLGVAPGSLKDGFLQSRTVDGEHDEMLKGIAIGLILIGLAVLTMGTGVAAAGVAAGSFALSGYMAFNSFQDYQLKEAANGTDFDRARAVSSEEPSLFWLALDIVATIADLKAAGSAFKALRAVPREVEAMARAARATEGGEPLAKRVTEHLPERAKVAEATAKMGHAEAAARYGLTAEELEAELKAVRGRTPKELPPDGAYDLEVAGKNHTWRRGKDGRWCMFSIKECAPREVMEMFEEFDQISRAHSPRGPLTSLNPMALTTDEIRQLPGAAHGGNKSPAVTSMFAEGGVDAAGKAIEGRITRFPGQVVAKLLGIGQFKNFAHFRAEFWKAVEKDPALRQGWGQTSLKRMADGRPPFVGDRYLSKGFKQANEKGIGNKVYQIDHMDDLKVSGLEGLYDMDRMQIVTAEVNQAFNAPH